MHSELERVIEDIRDILILGAGISGQAVARYFIQVEHCPNRLIFLDESNLTGFLIQEGVNIPVVRQLDTIENLEDLSYVFVSPGFDPKGSVLKKILDYLNLHPERKNNFLMTSDINLFAQKARAPIIAVTGTNGKSTVVNMISHVLKNLGLKIQTGGNIGNSPLDFLIDIYLSNSERPDFYVLEISSFQMEWADNLKPKVGMYLNLTPDHLERHGDMETYGGLKQKLLDQSEIKIIYEDLIEFKINNKNFNKNIIYFGVVNKTINLDFYLSADEKFLMHQDKILLPRDALSCPERHNVLNALAALGVVSALGLDLNKAVNYLKNYTPLAHRTALVTEINGVRYINDSKGTNIGATEQAILSFKKIAKQLVLMLGGVAKNQDFNLLMPCILDLFNAGQLNKIILLGRDGALIHQVILGLKIKALEDKIIRCETLSAAVEAAHKFAKKGDVVLFSPACASFDQFKNYAHRGECFERYVREI